MKKNLMKKVLVFAVLVLAGVFTASSVPNPGHPASEIGGGTFDYDSGENFYFPVDRSTVVLGNLWAAKGSTRGISFGNPLNTPNPINIYEESDDLVIDLG